MNTIHYIYLFVINTIHYIICGSRKCKTPAFTGKWTKSMHATRPRYDIRRRVRIPNAEIEDPKCRGVFNIIQKYKTPVFTGEWTKKSKSLHACMRVVSCARSKSDRMNQTDPNNILKVLGLVSERSQLSFQPRIRNNRYYLDTARRVLANAERGEESLGSFGSHFLNSSFHLIFLNAVETKKCGGTSI